MEGVGYTPGTGTQVAIETSSDGKLVQLVKTVVLNPWSYAGVTGGIVDTADVVLMAAPGVGKRIVLTSLQVHNSSATSSEIVLKSGATVIWRGYVPNVMTMMQNIVMSLRAAENTPLTFAVLVSGTATRISAQGTTENV